MASSGPDFAATPTEVARRLYEDSRVPLKDVAAQLGLSPRSLHRRAQKWGWARHAGGIRAQPLPRRTLIARLVTRIEAEIAAVERLVARAGLEAEGGVAADTERAARTLAVLVRSLRELAALERGEENEIDDEEMPRDAEAYRRELAATLERVLADRTA
ncbi:hypothetical protein MKI84_13085 [Ancylobacter sp. A5.8]|uniref:hypothetical protein n=1 Tax=Ancylobacter gelatini TaxID=2919920 RepID=UPI001F4F0071|nr:hypothetical protein [Ancylobacter gelatini]MCJ8143852.1 hypothetical protein [Ancylobacter gelatini]